MRYLMIELHITDGERLDVFRFSDTFQGNYQAAPAVEQPPPPSNACSP